jgi:hypothetical protein
VYRYNWYWSYGQINVSVYLTDVICKSIWQRVFCSCSGMELGLATGPMSLNQ